MNAKKIIFLLICFAAISFAQNENSITLKDGLILKSLSASRGSIFSADPIELKIIRGKWETPEEGDSVSSGTAT